MYFQIVLFMSMSWVFRECVGIFTTSMNIERLFDMETEIITISENLLREEKRLQGEVDLENVYKINSTLQMVKAIHTTIDTDVDVYLSHPVNVYHLSKRFISHWSFVLATYERSDYCRKALRLRLDNIQDNIPEKEDMDEIANGISELCFLHDISPDDAVKGNLSGHVALSPLDLGDVFHIAQAAHDGKKYYITIQWLKKATEMCDTATVEEIEDAGINQTNTLSLMASTYYKLKLLDEAVNTMDKLLALDGGNALAIKNRDYYTVRRRYYMHGGDKSLEKPKPQNHYRRIYEDICSGQLNASRRSSTSSICTYYQTNIPILRRRVELMSIDPLIMIIHDIASPDMTKAILNMGKKTMKNEAKEGRHYYNIPSIVVTDKSLWKWLPRLRRRYIGMHDLTVAPLTVSDMEIRNFGMHGTCNIPLKKLTKYSKGGRVGSFALFLNDIGAGGEIAFPRERVKIPVKRGSAVFWYSTATQPAICPVLNGNLWTAWQGYFEEKSQTQCRPSDYDYIPKHMRD